MDSEIIMLVALALVASGCASSGGTDSQGVKVQKFSVSDNTLTPDQQTLIEATITNHNEAPTEIKSENIQLFNTGQLEVQSKTCSPKSIESQREGISPSMNCQWTVKAPGESYLEGFESKPIALKMRLLYSSTLENQRPLKIDFQKLEDITQSGTTKISNGNGDLTLKMNGESPSSKETSEPIDLEVKEVGPGRLVSNYTINCTPKNLFQECPQKLEPIQGEAQTTLNAKAQSKGVRNIFISISYKYEKNPNLDIKVVNK